MKFRVKQTIPLLFFPPIALAWFYLADAFFWDVTFSILQPLYIYSIVTLPLAAILIFVKKKVFNSWFKFALWWIPLSVFVIAMMPVTSGSWFPLYSIVREDAAWFMGVLFSAVSISRIFSQTFIESRFPSGWGRALCSWVSFSAWWVLFSTSLFIVSFFKDFIHPPLSFFPPFWIVLFLAGLFVCSSPFVLVWNAFVAHYEKKLTHHPV